MEPFELLRPFPGIRSYLIPGDQRPAQLSRAEAKKEFSFFIESLRDNVSYIESVLLGAQIDLRLPAEERMNAIGVWLFTNGRTRLAKSALPHYEPNLVETLTIPTWHACAYVGLLFGEALIESLPGLRWDLVTESKRDMYYHHPVVRRGKSQVSLEPTTVVGSFLLSALDAKRLDRSLGDFWKIWDAGFAKLSD